MPISQYQGVQLKLFALLLIRSLAINSPSQRPVGTEELHLSAKNSTDFASCLDPSVTAACPMAVTSHRGKCREGHEELRQQCIMALGDTKVLCPS